MSVGDVVAFVRSLELGNVGEIYASRFEGAGIEWDDVLELDDSSLAQLGVNQLHRRKILRAVGEQGYNPPAVQQGHHPTSYRLAALAEYGKVMDGAERAKLEAENRELRDQVQQAEERLRASEATTTAAKELRQQLDAVSKAMEGEIEKNRTLEAENQGLRGELASAQASMDGELADTQQVPPSALICSWSVCGCR